jgi:hypothetical protein
MYPHRIRLRGPWLCEPLLAHVPGGTGAVAALPAARRVTLPARWGDAGLADFAGRVRFRRRFGYPGRIDDYERVWLTFAGLEGSADVTLNDRPLGRFKGTAGPFECAVTPLLAPRNLLDVDVEGSGAETGLWGEVALEVRRTAFLRRVRAWAAPDGLHVAGEVAGFGDGVLELYAVRGRSTVAYATAAAAPEGRPFHLVGEPSEAGVAAEADPPLVRVELVGGAVVWYAVDVPLETRTDAPPP